MCDVLGELPRYCKLKVNVPAGHYLKRASFLSIHRVPVDEETDTEPSCQ